VNRSAPLVAGLVLAVSTLLAPGPAGAGNASLANCGDGRYFSVALKVDRARLKTHKRDRRLVRVIIKNPCDGYFATGWGHLPANSDNDRVMIVVAPGVKVDWDAADLSKLKLNRDFNWSGNGEGPAKASPAGYRCARPTHLLTHDRHGQPRLARYRPDTTGCPKA
jgi:hypothetical protein